MSLNRDLTRDELMGLREQGMTNQEIADSLDVTYQTVYKIIGRQPKGIRKSYSRSDEMFKNSEPIDNEGTQDEACLIVGNRTVCLMGEIGEYSVDYGSKSLTIKVPPLAIWKEETESTVAMEDIQKYIESIGKFLQELKTINKKADTFRMTNEMW